MENTTTNLWEMVIRALAEDIEAPDDGRFQEASWFAAVYALTDDPKSSAHRTGVALLRCHEKMQRRMANEKS